jgi:iron complex outermembrane recepter protein
MRYTQTSAIVRSARGNAVPKMLLSTVALIFSCGASAAEAQAAAASSQQQPAGGPSQASQDVTIDEVIVTAQRKTESIQRSSLAISVVTVQEMKDAGVVQVRDLTKAEPAVQIGQGGPATQIYIRGVGDFGSTPVTNPAVAFNVDGVYVSRANSIEGNFYDLERVEVVKGPQGTLYGRNATGGAINVITSPAQLGTYSAHIEGEAGDYSLGRVEGFVNAPVGDTFAMRVGFQVVSRNGFSGAGFDDDKEQSVRLSTRWEPTSQIDLRLTYDHTHVGGEGPAYVVKGPFAPELGALVAAEGSTLPTNPRMTFLQPQAQALFYAGDAAGGLCIPSFVPAASSTKSGLIGPGNQGACPAGFISLLDPGFLKNARHMDNNFDNFTAQLNADLGFATLTVVPAYRRVQNNYITFPLIPYDDAANGKPEASDTYSTEVRLARNDPKFNWIGGLYWYREDQSAQSGGDQAIYLLSGNAIAQSKFTTKSEAAFGQASYSIIPAWRLILGARLSHDDRTIAGANTAYDSPVFGLPFTPTPQGVCFLEASPCVTDTYKGDQRNDHFTYKAGTEYDINEEHMLYVTYSTGYKAGGFNQFSAPFQPGVASAYSPEKLRALESGSRHRFFESRVQINLEGFYWKYENAQETFATENGSGQPVFGYTNAGSATMSGFDADLVARLTVQDTLRFGAEYLQSRFDRFTYTSLPVASFATGCQQTIAGPVSLINCSGKPLVRAPNWSGKGSLSHKFDLPHGSALEATVAAQAASARYLSVDYTPASRAGAYIQGDVYATFKPQSQRWSLTGYVRNFNNALNYTGAFTIPFALPGVVGANLQPPRTFGAIVGFDF